MWGAGHSGDPTEKEEYSQVKGDSAEGPRTSRVTDLGEGCVGQQRGRDRTESEHKRHTGVGTCEGCAWRPVCLEGRDRLEEEQ